MGCLTVLNFFFKQTLKSEAMKKIFITVLINQIMLLGLQSQSISRSAICSFGSTQSNSVSTLTSTFGQCPGCTSLKNGSTILTQGFQQANEGIDCFFVAFDYESETSVCGQLFDFFYNGNANIDEVMIEWDFGMDGYPQTSNLANPAGVAFSETGTKTIALRIFNDSCDFSASAIIQVDSAGFGTNPLVQDIDCKGNDSGIIALELTGGMAPFSFQWSNGENSQSLSNLTPGVYGYTVTDVLGCESARTLTLTEPEEDLILQFDVTSETCIGTFDASVMVTVQGGTAPYEFRWSDGFSFPIMNNIASGEYFITVTDANDCQTAASLLIGQKCQPQIYNTITPNEDGINDFWKIPDIELFPENEVRIYNRWGELVFETNGYANTWNGRSSNGKNLSDGAYFYVVRLNNANDSVLTGSITVIR